MSLKYYTTATVGIKARREKVRPKDVNLNGSLSEAGAEFGYNKAKVEVEVEDSYRESLCNSELNLASVTEQLEELEKSNEWHFVKDGDYPPLEKGYCTINVLTDREDIAYYNYDDDYWIAEPASVEIDPPVAWCKIPKYKE